MYVPLFIALGEFGVKELLLLTIIGLPLYFIPTIVAFSRQSKNKLPIALVNFLLGWTGLGWIGSLLWACLSDNGSNLHIYNNQTLTHSTQTTTGADSGKKVEILKSLKDLHDSGVLSDEEFAREKEKVLGGG
ncbi:MULTISPECIES: superinfection immunity protein [unclassified Flavobacterium]|uniref:superinfection immunity protein n=1 Tax=unclassified Flavobacterium TaxID=196869 RepID=UPI001F13EFD1|nr:MULTISPECIES: superinfection immunity protein [unclassified Flavobacterium]UMY65092.1 superinfection immunity protein [Flavobacterium sp. HJ-32-4]